MAYYFYGLRALAVTAVSVLTAVVTNYLCFSAMKKKLDWGDVSPLMSGLLLALMMPAAVPYTVMAFASAFMIISHNALGGNKNSIFCPVCVSYIFTALCFPSYIVRYPLPAPFGSVSLDNIVGDTLTHSYTYFLDAGTSSAFSLLDIIWGRLAGPMGSSAILIILICGIALYFFGDIPPTAFFAGFGANVLINVLFPVGESGWYAVLNSLVAGSYLFALVFLACDPRYVPKRAFSQILYGVIFAGGSYLVRMHTSIENGAIFVLPLLCIFRDEFDRLSSALERLVKFLWKWTKILSVKFAKKFSEIAVKLSKTAWKYLKIGAIAAWKFTLRCFDGFCEFIARKITEHSDRKKAAKQAEEKAEEAVGEAAENAEETAVTEEPEKDAETEESAEAAKEEKSDE